MRRTIAMAISLTDGTVPQFIGRQSQGPEGVDRAPHERPLPLRVTWSRGSKWRSERSGLRPTRLGRLFAHSLHRRVCVWPKLKRVSARLSDENGPTILALCTRCSDSVLAFGSGWPRSMLWRVERWGRIPIIAVTKHPRAERGTTPSDHYSLLATNRGWLRSAATRQCEGRGDSLRSFAGLRPNVGPSGPAVPKVTGQGCQLAQHVLLQGVLARGWLDLPATLQPVEDNPAKGGPGCADAPAGEHVGGIVNTEVDTTDADSDGEQDRQAEEIDLEP